MVLPLILHYVSYFKDMMFLESQMDTSEVSTIYFSQWVGETPTSTTLCATSEISTQISAPLFSDRIPGFLPKACEDSKSVWDPDDIFLLPGLWLPLLPLL